MTDFIAEKQSPPSETDDNTIPAANGGHFIFTLCVTKHLAGSLHPLVSRTRKNYILMLVIRN
jgi:hypothetical protein